MDTDHRQLAPPWVTACADLELALEMSDMVSLSNALRGSNVLRSFQLVPHIPVPILLGPAMQYEQTCMRGPSEFEHGLLSLLSKDSTLTMHPLSSYHTP
jgi:hypothetical protein